MIPILSNNSDYLYFVIKKTGNKITERGLLSYISHQLENEDTESYSLYEAIYNLKFEMKKGSDLLLVEYDFLKKSIISIYNGNDYIRYLFYSSIHTDSSIWVISITRDKILIKLNEDQPILLPNIDDSILYIRRLLDIHKETNGNLSSISMILTDRILHNTHSDYRIVDALIGPVENSYNAIDEMGELIETLLDICKDNISDVSIKTDFTENNTSFVSLRNLKLSNTMVAFHDTLINTPYNPSIVRIIDSKIKSINQLASSCYIKKGYAKLNRYPLIEYLLSNSSWVDKYYTNPKVSIRRLYPIYWYIIPFNRKYNDIKEDLFNINRAHYIIKDNPTLNKEGILRKIAEVTVSGHPVKDNTVVNNIFDRVQPIDVLITWLKEQNLVQSDDDIKILLDHIPYDNIKLPSSSDRLLNIADNKVQPMFRKLANELFLGNDTMSKKVRQEVFNVDETSTNLIQLSFTNPSVDLFETISKNSDRAFSIRRGHKNTVLINYNGIKN